MASAIYSEAPASHLSISLESSSTASPFPSPSSSFLPPPTPGAHEFAVKPAPSGRASRKSSTPSLLSSSSRNASPGPSPRSSSMITTKSDSAPVPESPYGQATMASTLDVKRSADHPQPQPQAMSSRMSGNPSPATEVASASVASAQSASPSPPPSTVLSPVTPTPSNDTGPTLAVPTTLVSPYLPVQISSSSASTTPTNHTMCLPPEHEVATDQTPCTQPSPGSLYHIKPPAIDVSTSNRGSLDVPGAIPRPRINAITQGSRPLSTASTASTASYASASSSASAFDPSLFSTRPAPPSPGGSSPSLSRRISTTSTRSKAGSKPVSRANSLRKGAVGPNSSPGPTLGARGEGAAGSHHNLRASVGSQLSQSFSLPSPLASPRKTEFDMGISASSPAVQETLLPSPAVVPSIPSEHSSGSPSTTSTSTSVSTSDVQLQPGQDDEKVFIKIRDFAFQPQDERYAGLGPLVPKSNRVGRMNRRLGGRTDSTISASSISSSDGDGAEDDLDGWGWGIGYGGGREVNGYGGSWGGFKMGMGRFGWTMNSGAGSATAATIFDQEKAYATAAANLVASTNGSNNNYPSRSDMDRNFLDSESEEYYDAEDDEGLYGDADEGEFQEAEEGREEEEEEEPLYPGLYRAMYAFEPEGTAEMRLVEDQIVRVVGRGGGVGWAVVVAPDEETEEVNSATEGGHRAPKHALVPEGYLEPYKLDWEVEEEAAAAVDVDVSSAKDAV